MQHNRIFCIIRSLFSLVWIFHLFISSCPYSCTSAFFFPDFLFLILLYLIPVMPKPTPPFLVYIFLPSAAPSLHLLITALLHLFSSASMFILTVTRQNGVCLVAGLFFQTIPEHFELTETCPTRTFLWTQCLWLFSIALLNFCL